MHQGEERVSACFTRRRFGHTSQDRIPIGVDQPGFTDELGGRVEYAIQRSHVGNIHRVRVSRGITRRVPHPPCQLIGYLGQRQHPGEIIVRYLHGQVARPVMDRATAPRAEPHQPATISLDLHDSSFLLVMCVAVCVSVLVRPYTHCRTATLGRGARCRTRAALPHSP